MNTKLKKAKKWVRDAKSEVTDVIHKNVKKRILTSKEEHPKTYKIFSTRKSMNIQVTIVPIRIPPRA